MKFALTGLSALVLALSCALVFALTRDIDDFALAREARR